MQIMGLRTIYSFDEENLRTEVLAVKSLIKSNHMTFNPVQELSSFILTKLKDTDFPLLHFFISLIVVLPFTADCERSFSAMNLIKNDLRNRLTQIFNDLMLIYRDKIVKIDMKKLAKKVVRDVWKYTKPSTFSEDYQRQLI